MLIRTKCDIRRCSVQDPACGAYSAPPDPLAVFKGPTSKGGRGKRGRGDWEGKGGQAPKYFGLEPRLS